MSKIKNGSRRSSRGPPPVFPRFSLYNQPTSRLLTFKSRRGAMLEININFPSHSPVGLLFPGFPTESWDADIPRVGGRNEADKDEIIWLYGRRKREGTTVRSIRMRGRVCARARTTKEPLFDRRSTTTSRTTSSSSYNVLGDRSYLDKTSLVPPFRFKSSPEEYTRPFL